MAKERHFHVIECHDILTQVFQHAILSYRNQSVKAFKILKNYFDNNILY